MTLNPRSRYCEASDHVIACRMTWVKLESIMRRLMIHCAVEINGFRPVSLRLICCANSVLKAQSIVDSV